MNETVSAPKPPTIREFAFRVAGPRDFLINLVVNGTIAWLVYGGRETVPLIGWHSIWVMLLPMALLESTLTTFFGYLAGALKRKAGAITPPLAPEVPWLNVAIRAGLRWGCGAAGVCIVVMLLLAVTGADVQLPPWIVIGGIGLFSGCLAYVLHTRAVLQAAKF